MRIERIEQMRDGMRAVATGIDNLVEGILVQENSKWFFLHNDPQLWHGGRPNEMRGYDYGWALKQEDNFDGMVLHSIISDARSLLYDRVKLIRCLEKTYEKAKENGDEATIKDIVARIRSDADGHFLSYSQEAPDKVSFAQKPEHRTNNQSRIRTTLGRYVRRQLGIGPDRLSDNGLAIITKAVFGILACGEGKIETISGDDITKAYRDSIGGRSCMTGSGADSRIGLYALNPDKVQMVIFDKMARALLWTCDDGTRVMDRIYPNDGGHVDVLHNWCKLHGIIYRVDNSIPSGTVQLSDGSIRRVTVEHDDSAPYLDTFHYGLIYYNKIELSNDSKFGDIEFCNTDGSLPDGETCEHCGCRIDPEDSCYENGNSYCSGCWGELYFCCDKCGEAELRDEVTEVEGDSWCSHCRDHHATRCEKCGDYVTETNDVSGENWCQSCTDDHAIRCVECDEYFKKEDTYECEDRKRRCEDCSSECETCGSRHGNDELEDGECESCREEADDGIREDTVVPAQTPASV